MSMRGYEYIGESETDYLFKKIYKKKHANTITRFTKKICTIADTIEELCDGLIVEDKDNTNNWFVMDISEYQSKDNEDKKYMVDRWNFYAFIKTDKGLIYVAKMNDKGELELL